ncbi:MAG TPA: hypothetical protein VIB59_04920 [Solirubrobacteraceae bacterium]|jgi:hypothetical protein
MSDPQGVPSEEELRAAYEAELARITASDMIAQAAVSLLNIGARRMGPPPGAEQPGAEGQAGAAPERDLEQVRDAIDAAMALLAILERRIPADQLAPLRDALSRLQMAYASEVRAGSGPPEGEGGPEGGPGGEGEQGGGQSGGGEGGGQGGSEGQQPAGDQADRRPGPAESSGRLWVPGT